MEAIRVHKKFTEEEYLLIERQSPTKNEFFEGEIFAMSGAKRNHNRIVENLSIVIGSLLKGKSCQSFSSDFRVHIPKNTLYTYPDFLVVYGDEVLVKDGYMDTLLDVTLIVEVLSPSTQSYDRGAKFNLYKSIEVLQEYILIQSEKKYFIEHYIKNKEGVWNLKTYSNLNDLIRFPSIGVETSLAEIYDKVNFI